jgi:hypothetical protein
MAIQSIDDLLSMILVPLETDQAALCQRIRQRFEETRQDLEEYGDELHALSSALRDYPDEYPTDWWMDPTHCRWWLFLSVDWKASDEVEWQCQAMARTLKLEAGFVSTVPIHRAQVLEVLTDAAAWFRQQGYELLCLNSGGDEYIAVPLRLDTLSRAIGVLDRMDIRSFQV